MVGQAEDTNDDTEQSATLEELTAEDLREIEEAPTATDVMQDTAVEKTTGNKTAEVQAATEVLQPQVEEADLVKT